VTSVINLKLILIVIKEINHQKINALVAKIRAIPSPRYYRVWGLLSLKHHMWSECTCTIRNLRTSNQQ